MADRADGSVVIKAVVDADNAEKELNKLKKKISDTERAIETSKGEKLPLVKQLEEVGVRLDEAKAKLYEMKTATQGAFGKEEVAEQAETVRAIQSEFNRAASAVERIDKQINSATDKLTKQKNEAGELIQRIEAVSAGTRAMAHAQEEAAESAKRFKLRIKEVVRSALVFTLITQTLAKFREWMGQVIQTNSEASASVARLKGALLTLAQPLLNVILPAFIALVNILTALVGKIAQITSALFGMTAAESAKAAEALNKETEALKGTGGAAKKASKSLASFDEINKLSSASSGGGASSSVVAPDFSWATGIDSIFSKIAEDVLLIAAGLALWKISEGLPGMLGTIGTKLAGIAIFVGGLMLLWDGLSDAWENGVDWGNLIASVGGLAAAVFGLFTVFGKLGGGIGLVVGGLMLIATGFRDAFENGLNLKNGLMILAGIIGTGLGITLLTGSLIPLLISGIAGILLAITILTGNGSELIESLKLVFSGLTEFISGVFTGDWERAWNGVKDIFKGVWNGIVTIVESAINFVISGLNKLIQKINDLLAESLLAKGASMLGIKTVRIPTIPSVEIPRLAQGAVIPPNREFMAVLGDQKSGTNIETPLSTMVQAFKQAMSETGGGGDTTVILELDGQQFGKATFKAYNRESRRVGVNLVGVN